MLKKYLTKFTVDILPSVAATVIGAYIVNHYIATKPGADAPVAATMSLVNPKAAPEAAKVEVPAADVGNIPEAGVKAKGISEKAIFEKSAAEKSEEKSQEKSQGKSSEKSADKPADKPAETASLPAETRRHQVAPREKAVAKAAPTPVQPAAPAVVPVVVAAPNPAPAAATGSTPEDRRDANDLARAAIERLRGARDGSPHPQEAARVPDALRIPEAARTTEASRVVSAPAIRPLPPPIMVSTPRRESVDSTNGSLEPVPPYADAARNDDPSRPTPPADIPSPPLDLRAEAGERPAPGHTTVADDVLSAAKSVFHAVLPK
jgi:hypothetical protein